MQDSFLTPAVFLFLSKLLPLFVYPLGLGCGLVLVALGLMWKRPRMAAIALSVAFLTLWLSSTAPVSDGLVRSLERRQVPTGPLPTADAIVVLGGATKPSLPPRPGVDVGEAGDRVIYGAQLFREGKAPVILLSGGRIRWRNGGQLSATSEAEDMAQLMELMGVSRQALVLEPDSLNTYENATNIAVILEGRGIRQILLVTSALHVPRALSIFRHLGIEAIAAPTDFLVPDSPDSPSLEQSLLDILPDAERLAHTTRALKEYLGFAIYRLRGWL
ncbi:YdcF family protein [Synechococcus sp. PCC 7336]|uniref:YdcF family protein n=1 Tax=Synechococcus sp. PCC 7336 TaxID=195250 RepID=UPI00034B9741|nr:YdcF family protein [Synechococcus sp. PCC 7336]